MYMKLLGRKVPPLIPEKCNWVETGRAGDGKLDRLVVDHRLCSHLGSPFEVWKNSGEMRPSTSRVVECPKDPK